MGKRLSEEVGGRIGLAIKLWTGQMCYRHIGDVDRGWAQPNSLAMTRASRLVVCTCCNVGCCGKDNLALERPVG